MRAVFNKQKTKEARLFLKEGITVWVFLLFITIKTDSGLTVKATV